MVKYYKIFDEKTDSYIAGTPTYCSRSNVGRLFPNLGSLRTFLTNILKHNKSYRNSGVSNPYQTDISGWVVEELELTLTDTKTLSDVVTAKKMMELLKN